MSLPNSLQSARLTDASIGDTIDNALGNAEKALADILGIPIDTVIAVAAFEIVVGGLARVILQNVGSDPVAVGQLLRNGALLKFHDGTAAQVLAFLSHAVFQTNSNAFGVRRVQGTVPADGDYQNGDITYVV